MENQYQLTNIDYFFLNLLIEQNLIMSSTVRKDKDKIAFLKILDIYLLPVPTEKQTLNFIKDTVKQVENEMIEYVFNFKPESFFAPLREIVKEYYKLSEEQVQNIVGERGWA